MTMGGSAITVINNARQMDGGGLGVAMVLGVAVLCVLVLLGLVLRGWLKDRKRKER